MALVAGAASAGRAGGSEGYRRKSAASAKPKFELKLLNSATKLEGELEALKKLDARRPWPAEVKKALSAAQKAADKAKQREKEKSSKELLERVRHDLAEGTAPAELRARLRPRLFVFDYQAQIGEGGPGRPRADRSQLEMLASSVSLIIASASKHDEALLRLTSPGGAVATYGLAAAQLQRLRDAGVRLTVCVDTVAASGGYMMACVADRVIAAPFAMVGSIGVIAGVPNFSKVLNKYDVDFEQVTAGKYKRTVNVLTPNTEEGLNKFKQDINIIHDAFKDHVARWRPSLDVEAVATGEVWLGTAALERGLVDEVGVSDSELRAKEAEGFDVIELAQAKEKSRFAQLFKGVSAAQAAEAFAARLSSAAGSLWHSFGRGGGAGLAAEASAAAEAAAAAPEARAPEAASAARVEAPHLRDLSQ